MSELYKVTAPNGEPLHGGSGRWPLPTQNADGSWAPGKWRTVRGPVRACYAGLHLTDREHLAVWLRRECVVWLAEARGPRRDEHDSKIAVGSARLVRPVLRVTPDLYRAWDRNELPTGSLTDGTPLGRPLKRSDPLAFFGARAALVPDRIIFGVHRYYDPRDAIAPAWPSAQAFAGRLRARTNRRMRAA